MVRYRDAIYLLHSEGKEGAKEKGRECDARSERNEGGDKQSVNEGFLRSKLGRPSN